jgi:hypothetical protein
VLPIARISFYAGNTTYSVVHKLFGLYQRCKEILDTNGNGWSEPLSDFSKLARNAKKIDLKKGLSGTEAIKACETLEINQNSKENILVPLPKFESDEGDDLTSIWLPLKKKHIFGTTTRASAFILFQYFVSASQCYNSQGIDQSNFNRKLKAWLVEKVLPRIQDEHLYPAFGGVLRIYETIKEPSDVLHETKLPKDLSSDRDDMILGSTANVDSTHNLHWWFSFVLKVIAGVVLLILIVLIVRRCRKMKLKKYFWESSHHPESDDFYRYKRVPGQDRNVSYENEKLDKSSRKQRFKKIKEKFKLPRLGTESETADDTLFARQTNVTFKISESSDEGPQKSQSSNSSKPSGSRTKFAQKSSRFLNKVRAKSPLRKNKAASSNPSAIDTSDEK